ncbi:MAG: tetratricopeptide repeat protein [Planctomycetota bacterium]
MAKSSSANESTAKYAEDAKKTVPVSSWFRGKAGQEELSPEFKAAQKNFKDPEKSLLAWARYQEDIGEYAEARKKYRELQIAYPDSIEAGMGLARIEMLTGRTRQAEEQLLELAGNYPENGNIQLELGAMYSKNEDYPQAIRAFEKACELDPRNEAYRYELGIALVRHGQYDEGLSHLSYAVGDSAAHYNIGYILHEQGNDADAIEWFRNALELHPDKQTAERASSMIAGLQASEEASSHALAARSASTKVSLHAQRSLTAGSNSRSAEESGRSVLEPARTLPAVDEEDFALTEQSRVAASRGIPLPPATDAEILPQDSDHFAEPEANPLRTVSWSSQSAVQSAPRAAKSEESAEPPQWKGPHRRAETREISTTPSGVQDPPSWRASGTP